MLLGHHPSSTSCGGVRRNPIPGNLGKTSTTRCFINGATNAGNVTRHTSRPQYLTHNTCFSLDAVDRAVSILLEIGCKEPPTQTSRGGFNVMVEELEMGLDSRKICSKSFKFPKAYGDKAFLGFFANVFQTRFASASEKEIRGDLSALGDELKLRKIQNETSTPALRSKSSAKKSPRLLTRSATPTAKKSPRLLTRSATPTDRVRCSDPVDSSASYCWECGLGGGVLLVTHQSTLHFCHSVNVFLAGMLQAELRRPFTSYMLRSRPGGPPGTIHVSPLQKPASKNEITFEVYRLHCCRISG